MSNKVNKILIDVIIGSIFIGIISYFTLIFDEHPEFLNISAFLWGVPLIYFYFILITYQKSKKAMKSFTIHGLIGQIMTIFISFVTLYMLLNDFDGKCIILTNIVYALLCLIFYFYFKIYNYF